MEYQNMLEEVEWFINKVKSPGCGTFILYVYNKQLQISKGRRAPKDFIPVAKLTEAELRHGLTGKKWTYINRKLITLQEQEMLCPITKKH